MMQWPKKPTTWIEDRVLYVSIPFTWNIPDVTVQLQQRSMFWDRAVVGGPAVYLMPEFFKGMGHVKIGYDYPGALQKVNKFATKTTTGCIRSCGFCAVRKLEGYFRELADWPNSPIVCDNNLLASSQKHFDKVMDRLVFWGWADFNQGLDSRLLTQYHAEKMAEIKKPMIRLALDSMTYSCWWEKALEKLLSAGIAKSNIRGYALIGFDSGPVEAWKRCEYVESFGIKVLPMWFHPLDALEKNQVTEDQKMLGWNDEERLAIFGWYYKHRGEKKYNASA